MILGLVYIIAFNHRRAIDEWKSLQFMQKILITIILIFYFSENILLLNFSNIELDFYEGSFYINIACTVTLIIFFSIFDFSGKTIKQMQLSFHKTDNILEDFESQTLN